MKNETMKTSSIRASIFVFLKCIIIFPASKNARDTQNAPNTYWRVNECAKIHCISLI